MGAVHTYTKKKKFSGLKNSTSEFLYLIPFLFPNSVSHKGSRHKNTIFYDIESEGGWVAVSKPNFLSTRNYDIIILDF